jgi:hypothetical protein
MIVKSRSASVCPYCRLTLTSWPRRALVAACSECRRWLIMVRSPVAYRGHRLFCLQDLVQFGVSLAIALIVLAALRDMISITAIMSAAGAALMALGIIDLIDGYTGLKTGIDRSWSRVRGSPAARRYSIGKYVYGSLSLLIGLFGLMIVLAPGG